MNGTILLLVLLLNLHSCLQIRELVAVFKQFDVNNDLNLDTPEVIAQFLFLCRSK